MKKKNLQKLLVLMFRSHPPLNRGALASSFIFLETHGQICASTGCDVEMRSWGMPHTSNVIIGCRRDGLRITNWRGDRVKISQIKESGVWNLVRWKFSDRQ
mmetsp:Transcript_61435/g.84414  ORF Transcript_61435/g.84414 Transcript_61435/m.84414 type:complete len:101 (-) Transcript_61435:185-487(-)